MAAPSIVTVLALVAGLIAPTTFAPAGARPPQARDIVLIVGDDVGYQDLLALRADGRAPHLAALAERGFEFTSCVANPVCSPTRRCLYFGDWRTRQSGDVDALPGPLTPPASLVSLAELVDWPSAFFGKWHVGSAAPSWQLAPQSHGFGLWRAGLRQGNEDYHDWLRIEDGRSFTSHDYEPAAVHQRWLEWWTTTRGPRLAVYAPQLAHAPFHRPPPEWLPPGYPPTDDERSRYEAMLVALDTAVGWVQRAVSKDTLVVFVGDNGTPDAVAPEPGRAKRTTFERGLRVPLILCGAGVPHGASDALVHAVDLYATVAELCGRAADPARASRSLVPLLGGGRAPHDYVLCGIRGDPRIPDDVCVRSARFKLRRTGRASVPPGVVESFHDLALDPDERDDVLADPRYAAEVAKHRAWLEAHLPGT